MIAPSKPFWSIHSHSRYSANDAMPTVAAMVSKAVALGYPALGLTDHRTVSGVVQLYRQCRKVGIEPLPGIELNVCFDRERGDRASYHLTVVAHTERGYRNLVTLNNLAQHNYFYRPMLDLADLALLSEQGQLRGLVVSTGCYFGLLQQTIERRGPAAGRRIVETLAGWFERVYVELHNHGVTHANSWTDEDMVWELIAISEQTGVPYLIAQDSHYLTTDQQRLHNGLKTLIAYGEDPSEAVFPGGPYSMVDNVYLETIYPADVVATSNDALDELAQHSNVWLPELEVFSMKVPDVLAGQDPDVELRRRTMAALETYKMPDSLRAVWREQLNSELDVIELATMPGYILLVADVCAFMISRGIWFHARGSASGSLVCLVNKITQVDPLRFGLRMDRFMSTDRTRPPDIDLDVEHRRRDEVIAWLQERFSVRQVGSHMQYTLWEEEGEETDGKGSLLVRYHSTAKKLGADERALWRDVPAEDKELLMVLSTMKLISGSGTHAAGYIVAPDEASVAELPLTWMPKPKRYVTSFGKKDVEALGFVKLDLLGSRNLTAERISCEAVHARLVKDGSIDPFGTAQEFWESIPDNDAETMKRISAGRTTGVFQLEGYTFTRECKKLKPRNLDEVIAAQALFRPAVMNNHGHEDYIARRNKRAALPEHHADIMEVTGETYGILLYQEQIITLLRMAGMPPAELTDTLDAVKASNEGTAAAAVFLEQTKPRIRQLVGDRGWSEDDIDWLLDGLLGYADYSFNKAHAAAYGTVSYRTAYLVTHYPVEFWLGMLTAFDDHKKEGRYVSAARLDKVKVAPAHVNDSGITYTHLIDRQIIRKGLMAIKDIGPSTATELVKHQPYTSLEDLGMRVTPVKVGGAKHLVLGKTPIEAGGKIAVLYEYGALDGLPVRTPN